MKSINPYLNFDGDARDAMQFYNSLLGGKLDLQTFKDAHFEAPDADTRILHARLDGGTPATLLMASDTQPGQPTTPEGRFWLTVDCDDVAEQDKLFNGLSGDGGTVLMPLQDTFWGARFGMLRDRYGINWMFNCELPKKS
jgi:PhnB protein